MTPPRRVAVFIDYQNCYGWARRAFCSDADPPSAGHMDPMKLAQLLASKAAGKAYLVYVGVYCGLPDASKDPRTNAARKKQMTRWEALGAKVIARPLRYPPGWRVGAADRPIEKGIDVKLSIDAVMMALRGQYDVAVIASCDTDLSPTVEAIVQLSQEPVLEERLLASSTTESGETVENVVVERVTEKARQVEVAVIAWVGHGSRLSVAGVKLKECWVGDKDFRAIRDETVYDVEASPPPAAAARPRRR